MSFKNLISCRDVLWWMVFSGIAVNFMLRVNLNLVIVAIVPPPENSPIISQCNQIDNTKINNVTLLDNRTLSTFGNYQLNSSRMVNDQLFRWNEYEQGLATGAYYWIHWLSEIPGGILARKYGTKVVFGIGNLMAALLGFFLPLAMNHHLYSLIFIRVIQGLVAGVAYPATHDMTAKWIPQNERSKFVSAYMGGGVGIGLTYPLCGFIIENVNWEIVFYCTSCFGIIWYILWLFLVYDTPQQHPRISEKEKNYILDNLGTSVDHEYQETSIPWRKILTSLPVWLTILSNWGAVWGYFTLMTQAPAYFKFIHGWSINKTGILSGLPHFMTMVFSWIFAHLCDWLLRTERLSITNVRKLATFICAGMPSLTILGLSFSGCYPALAVFFILCGIAGAGASSSGPLANLVDLSPNYASVLLGICGLVVDIAGFLSPIVVGILTNENQH
ncbi:vesicular glutamate transporter 3-like isoform X2 [Chelonus insularis]|uniref:vesicular glutamate transporter 3-like isoform X2 n=1 Tax=Chelonus insularis TaxID=460826 RepID=UPI00158BC047|nr:vesicular glutamate transporter 3-like isoform X2 [Chelonus insularis]